jgi:uncharacterized protein YjbI with pentapeptide repeats
MSGADLSYSDLSGAQLEETNLSQAIFTRADIFRRRLADRR